MFISIGLLTGSVVVPATELTILTSCDVSKLTNDDLPALRGPNIPMCVRSTIVISILSPKAQRPSVLNFQSVPLAIRQSLCVC